MIEKRFCEKCDKITDHQILEGISILEPLYVQCLNCLTEIEITSLNNEMTK
jgi:hypothetical protein